MIADCAPGNSLLYFTWPYVSAITHAALALSDMPPPLWVRRWERAWLMSELRAGDTSLFNYFTALSARNVTIKQHRQRCALGRKRKGRGSGQEGWDDFATGAGPAPGSGEWERRVREWVQWEAGRWLWSDGDEGERQRVQRGADGGVKGGMCEGRSGGDTSGQEEGGRPAFYPRLNIKSHNLINV